MFIWKHMNVESNCLIVSFGLCCLFILETSFDSHLCNGFGLCRNAKFYGSVFLYNPHYVCVCVCVFWIYSAEGFACWMCVRFRTRTSSLTCARGLNVSFWCSVNKVNPALALPKYKLAPAGLFWRQIRASAQSKHSRGVMSCSTMEQQSSGRVCGFGHAETERDRKRKWIRVEKITKKL